MTFLTRCVSLLPVMFWQIVNLSVFAYACAFYFFTDDVNKLYLQSQEENSLKFTGVLFALTSAGLNQMVACNMSGTPGLLRFASASSLLMYILASVAGVVVLVKENTLFIDEQRIIFLVLFCLFIAGVFVGLVGTCRGFCKIEAGAGGAVLETVVTADLTTKRSGSVPKSRAELVAAARNP